MNNSFRIAISLICIGLLPSFALKNITEQKWTRYDLETLALFADVPSYLEAFCVESMCDFQSPKEKPFESIRIERFYLNRESEKKFLKNKTDTSTNYMEISIDSISIHVKSKILTTKDERPSSWAYFSTSKYEYRLAYTGPNPESFIRFLMSIKIDYEKLYTQYEKNKIDPDYSKLNLEFDINLGDKDYVIYRTKNRCKIQMPKSDSIHFSLLCDGCMLSKIENDEYDIYPSPQGDTIIISLQTSLPENRKFTFDKKVISVRRE